jgi:protein required for attachment to host cells
MRTCSADGVERGRAAGGCSAVRCSACVKEQTRAQGSKSQGRQTRSANRERGDAVRQEKASHARQV